MPSKHTLSDRRRDLLELMQRLNFGRIESLAVRNGEPTFDPGPRVVREIKLGSENSPRPELERWDFELKPQVVELFSHLTELGNGAIQCIDVKHGLPFRLVIEQDLSRPA